MRLHAVMQCIREAIFCREPSRELEALKRATRRVDRASDRIEKSAGVLIRVAADMRGDSKSKRKVKK